MTHSDQIKHLYDELQKVIQHTAAEFSLPVASVIGVLDTVKMDLFVTEREKRIDDEDG